MKTGLYVGRIIKFQVADNYAFYKITRIGTRTVSVKYASGYTEQIIGMKGSVRKELAESIAATDDAQIKSRLEHATFYSLLTPGQIVHYCAGRSNYVRCEVILVTQAILDLNTICDLKLNDKALKPFALLGDWRNYELTPDAVWVKWIRTGHIFTPNYTQVWESPGYTKREWDVDPTNLPPLVLPE